MLFFFLPVALFLIEFIGVRLVNIIIYVSSVQFFNTPSAYYIVCSPSKVVSFCHRSPSILFYLPHTPFSLTITTLLLCLRFFSWYFCLIPSMFLTCSLTLYTLTAVFFLFCLLVYLFSFYFWLLAYFLLVYLFIRFCIWVKSYGIFLSLTDLFHLT